MNEVLERWNLSGVREAEAEVLSCCGSRMWAREMAATRPLGSETDLLHAAERVWRSLPEEAWTEAFASHPRIGERVAPRSASVRSAAWSAEEQGTAMEAEAEVKEALREANARYEQRFGRVFLVCATGRTSREILGLLERRMLNDERTELHEAAEQQRQITELRLERWMGGK